MRKSKIYTVLILFIAQSASGAFVCDYVKNYHDNEAKLRQRLTNEINRTNELIEAELRAQQTIWVPKEEKAKRQESLLRRSSEHLNSAKELLAKVQVLASNEMTDQSILTELNESLKQNLQSSPISRSHCRSTISSRPTVQA
ncbi:MAG: hypothetical protein HC902_08120 [Calothrix sp. SM1_5_4]|nr:hypothetical protein [Calothrix sp. SM1_5_4]